MSTYEHDILQQYKDESGNIHVLYPVTKSENVDGIEKYAQTMEMNQAIASRVSVSEFNSSVAAIRTGLATKPNYEKGTFKPSFLVTPSSLQSAKAAYIRIGNIVHISMSFQYSSAVKLATEMGGFIKGLPFAVKEDGPTNVYYLTFVETSVGNYSGLASYDLYMDGVYGVQISNVAVNNDSTKKIIVQGTYETNA